MPMRKHGNGTFHETVCTPSHSRSPEESKQAAVEQYNPIWQKIQCLCCPAQGRRKIGGWGRARIGFTLVALGVTWSHVDSLGLTCELEGGT